jgi:hypothetical protein
MPVRNLPNTEGVEAVQGDVRHGARASVNVAKHEFWKITAALN